MKIDAMPMAKGATLSPCGKFRYNLTRTWAVDGPKLFVIGLNCSTADHEKNDPTIRREISFAMDWRYGGLLKGNLFAYRTKNPAEMKRAKDPIGPETDNWLSIMASGAQKIVAAWGTHGSFMDRDRQVLALLKGQKLWCFGLTKEGHPKHPLYLKGNTELIEYHPNGRR